MLEGIDRRFEHERAVEYHIYALITGPRSKEPFANVVFDSHVQFPYGGEEATKLELLA